MCKTTNESTFVLSWIMAVLQMPVCFMPQLVKMWRQHTHIGVNVLNQFFASIVCWMSFVGYLCTSWQDTFTCCMPDHTAHDCAGAIAPVIQAFFTWFGTCCIIVLWYKNFDRPGLAALGRDAASELATSKKQLLVTTLLTVLILAVPLALAAAAGSIESKGVTTFGSGISFAMCCITASHWSVQIYETWLVRGLGSLSAFFLLVASGGSLVSGYTYLSAPFVSLGNFICGTMIGIVLVLGLTLQRIDDKERARTGDSKTPLTGGSQVSAADADTAKVG